MMPAHRVKLMNGRNINEEFYDDATKSNGPPSAAGMRAAFGTGAATNSFADIERADLFLIAGANVTEAHPVIGARIKEAVLCGAKLIVIDPRKSRIKLRHLGSHTSGIEDAEDVLRFLAGR